MHPLSKPTVDLSGQRFGRLVAISYVAGSPKKAWMCKCDCGATVEIRGRNLRIGKTRSCGCLKRDNLAAGIAVAHGMTRTPTYKSWNSMIGRCTNPAEPTYRRYGGAGVTVCREWRKFAAFLSDMGIRPSGTTLDRIDVQGNYEPKNCRWASAKVQANNRGNNRLITYGGKRMTIRQLCDLTGADYSRTRDRICKLGWDVQRAISTPAQNKRKTA